MMQARGNGLIDHLIRRIIEPTHQSRTAEDFARCIAAFDVTQCRRELDRGVRTNSR